MPHTYCITVSVYEDLENTETAALMLVCLLGVKQTQIAASGERVENPTSHANSILTTGFDANRPTQTEVVSPRLNERSPKRSPSGCWDPSCCPSWRSSPWVSTRRCVPCWVSVPKVWKTMFHIPNARPNDETNNKQTRTAELHWPPGRRWRCRSSDLFQICGFVGSGVIEFDCERDMT